VSRAPGSGGGRTRLKEKAGLTEGGWDARSYAMQPLLRWVALAALFAASVQAAPRQLVTFTKQQLTDKFWAEGIAVGDLNRNGHADVVYGPFWFAGPDFKERHEYRPATATFQLKDPDGTERTVEGFEGGLGINNAYSDNFFTWTYDFNQDGWLDILVVGIPNAPAHWYENPRGKSGHWQRHTVFSEVDNESPAFTDLTGDGRPELVCNHKGHFGYARPDWSDPSRPWTFHPITPNNNYHRYHHGLGVGDVNGDGRMDLLEKDGWWEQPESLAGDPVWRFHPFVFSPPTEPGVPVGGAQMFAYDVNGNGLNDVITCFASHGYWLVWWEQVRSGDEITFRQHTLTGRTPEEGSTGVAFSQIHAIELVDIDGDGLLDILTGKRFWAHGPSGDPEPNAPAVVYWFQLVRHASGAVEYVPWLIDDNSGVGTEVAFGDVTGNGRPDVITGNKKGAFVFRQQARTVSQAEWEKAIARPQ
jgi:hypothetical protein